MQEKILIADVEQHVVELLRCNLEQEGYVVSVANYGSEVLALAERERPDLVILDLMLPGVDGLEVCRLLRQVSNVPILVLTSQREETDLLTESLELGADDYVTKPFHLRELIARIRAILRRSRGWEAIVLEEVRHCGDITIYPEQHKVLIGTKEVDLTAKEFELLELLTRYPGRAFSREELLKHLWGYDFVSDSRTIDVHIRHLREKIEVDPGRPNYIKTVRSVGYKFDEQGSS
ncbi:MAG: winged helix-turn-helix domain-containing protein [bacterium]|jgi:two-component system alkaline phosphatase synthesis response regulator PhoP